MGLEKDPFAELWDKEVITIELEVTTGFLETIDRFVLSKGYGFEDLGEYIRSAMRKLLGKYAVLDRTRGTPEKTAQEVGGQ